MLGLCCNIWDLVHDQGLNPGPLHWESRVLTTELPGKSQKTSYGHFLLLDVFNTLNQSRKVWVHEQDNKGLEHLNIECIFCIYIHFL